MSKKHIAGSEIDAWCTKCKLDLNHRIIAVKNDRIARVECLTCRGHHQYRRPKSAEPPARAKRTTRKAAPRAAAGARARATAATKLREAWEEATTGKTASNFTKYNTATVLQEGQLVRHKKFGDGIVAEVLEGDKVSILFEPGTKTLIHSRK